MKNFIKKILFRPFIAARVTRLLVRIHQLSYSYLGPFAAVAEGGLHPKHRLIKYHHFFVDHIPKGHTVLDVGCNNGALLKDIAMKTDAPVVGVELSESNVAAAKKHLIGLSNIEIIRADIREYKADRHFDTIVLSNVMEHLDRRVEILNHLNEQFSPAQFLIRVPMFEREWLVPYVKELGLEWRLDPTHETEYTTDEFHAELKEAALTVSSIFIKWGEIYAVAVPLEIGNK